MKLTCHGLRRCLLASSLVFVATVTSVFADTATLQSASDTGLFQNAPNNNLGAQSFMPVGSPPGTRARGLVRFDFDGQIPANAVINSARLTLRVVLDKGGSLNVDLHRMLKPWTEGTHSGGANGSGSVGAPASTGETTWNNRAHPSTPWGTPGAQAGSDYFSTASASAPVSASQISFSSAGLLADVQRFVSTPSTNFGWLIKNQNESTQGARRIATREDSVNAPTLVVDFTVPGGAPVAITSPSPLPSAMVGTPYSFTFTVTNGTAPFSWSVTAGSLPAGLSLTTGGVLSGTPTNAGNFNFTAQVVDNAGASTNKTFSLTINPPALTISSSSPLPAGAVDVAYSQTLTVSGGMPPYNWLLASGALPGGLTLSSGGVLSGTPTNAGGFNFTVQVTDATSALTNKAFALTIDSPLQIASVNLVGNEVHFQFTAQADRAYAVEFRASLASGDWQTLTNFSAQATSTNVTVTDLISSVARFYRLRTP